MDSPCPIHAQHGASGSTAMFEQRPLYVGGVITGRREKLHFLPVFGHFLLFLKYWIFKEWKNGMLEKKKLGTLTDE